MTGVKINTIFSWQTNKDIKNKGAFHPDDLVDPPPDGGFAAWTAATCLMALNFTSWGSVLSYSVFLNFYLTRNELPGITRIDYAVVAGLTMCFILLCSWFVLAMLKVVPLRIIIFAGALLQFAGMLLASFAVNFWQLILTEGILSGVGCGVLFSTAVCLIPSWFLKRRTIASGAMFAGTGLGGCVFSLAAQAIIDRTGNQKWALRAIAIICIVLNVIAGVFARTRFPLHGDFKGQSPFKVLIKAIISPVQPKIWFLGVSLMIIGFFCISTILYIIILYSLSNFAVSVGLSAKDGSNAIAILNASQFVGRALIGIAGDHVGPFNILITMACLCVVFSFAFWIPVTTLAGVISFSVFMGLVMGYQFVAISPIVADFFGIRQFPIVWCFICICNSVIGLTSGLMAFGLKDDLLDKPYLHSQIYTGCLFLLSTLFLFPLRQVKVRNVIRQWEAEEGQGEWNHLLRGGLRAYFSRMFYSIKI